MFKPRARNRAALAPNVIVGLAFLVSSCTTIQSSDSRALDTSPPRASEFVVTDKSFAPASNARATTLEPARSPDGARLARARKGKSGMESQNYEIVVEDRNGNWRIVGNPVNCFGAAWSPDGRVLAYSEGTMIHLVDADGATRNTIYKGPGGPYPGAAFDLEWSNELSISFIQVESTVHEDLSNPQRVTLQLSHNP